MKRVWGSVVLAGNSTNRKGYRPHVSCENGFSGMSEDDTITLVGNDTSEYAASYLCSLEISSEVMATLLSGKSNPTAWALAKARGGFQMGFCERFNCNQDNPYWRSNRDWWYFDREKNEYFLTDEAPERARRSFERFMTPLPYPVKERTV